jgi:hypothetical protein
MLRVRIEITKQMMALDAEATLFGSDLFQAYFGVRIAFQSPRSFRLFGGINIASKSKVKAAVAKKFQEIADAATEKIEFAQSILEQAKEQGVDKINDAQDALEKAKAPFDAAQKRVNNAQDALDKADDWLKDKNEDVKNMCNPNRCCKKRCPGEKKKGFIKRGFCKLANFGCKLLVIVIQGLLKIARVALWAAEKLLDVVKLVLEVLQIIIDIAIILLEVLELVLKVAVWIAQMALNVVKLLVQFGMKLITLIIEGALELFWLEKFEFDVMLSADQTYLAVKLDFTLLGKFFSVGFKINFGSIVETIKNMIKKIVDGFKKLMGFGRRSRREIDYVEAELAPPSSQWQGATRRYAQSLDSNVHFDDLGPAVEDLDEESVLSMRTRREAHVFETVCIGDCLCKSCAKSVQNLLRRLHSTLLDAKTANTGIKRAAQAADSYSTLDFQETSIVEALNEFQDDELARRETELSETGGHFNKCASADNITECILINEAYDAELNYFSPNSTIVNQMAVDMRPEFEGKRDIAVALHKIVEDSELSGWRNTVIGKLFADTEAGIGCPEIECVGVADCLITVARYVQSNLKSLSDTSVCSGAFASEFGGCDESQRLAMQSFELVSHQWNALVPGLVTLFNPPAGATVKLATALELVDKSRTLLAGISPTEMCGGRVVMPDASNTANQMNTDMHGPSPKGTRRRAFPPLADTQNQLLNQIPQYSSLCKGSGVMLTDGWMNFDSDVFGSCEENEASVEIPTLEPAIITTVQVGKRCIEGSSFDPSVAGLLIQIRTGAGIFSCGEIASAADAACTGDPDTDWYWERRCDRQGVELTSTAVVLVRQQTCTPWNAPHCMLATPQKSRLLVVNATVPPEERTASFGEIVLTEIQAQGRPIAVSNVLLGQRATSNSQCHERPTFSSLGTEHSTQYPSMPGLHVIDVSNQDKCLEACQSEAACVAASYIDDGFDAKTCLIAPAPIKGEDVVWTNLDALEEDGNNDFDDIVIDGEVAVAIHFTKSSPFQRLEFYDNHVHDGEVLRQFCVDDIAVCKHQCVNEMHCTGFTFYGEVDDKTTPKVCSLTGNTKNVSTQVFSDGPFAQIPDEGIFADIGRPPRMDDYAEYNTTLNYAIVLGLDKATDGFYQPLAAEGGGKYTRQGFLHTCGLTDNDEVSIPTAELSRVYYVRVWKRCDAHEQRAVGLKIMQLVELDAETDTAEWRDCGVVTTDDDAICTVFGVRLMNMLENAIESHVCWLKASMGAIQ